MRNLRPDRDGRDRQDFETQETDSQGEVASRATLRLFVVTPGYAVMMSTTPRKDVMPRLRTGEGGERAARVDQSRAGTWMISR